MSKKIIYDITDKENSLQTLENLTGLKKDYWEHYVFITNVMQKDIDKAIDDVISLFDLNLDFNPKNIVYCVQHITTSSNGCANIKKIGLVDLVESYTDYNTELRQFLEQQEIKIDLLNEEIFYKNTLLGSIHFSHNRENYDYSSKAHHLWAVGRKFYYDYCICGFLSFDHEHPYGGNVHERPEILFNISELIGKRIDDLWRDTHKCYVIKFSVPFLDTHCNIEGNIQRGLLCNAFWNAMREKTDEIDVLLKDGIKIPANKIISIDRFDFQ